jgi:hypothetical protein
MIVTGGARGGSMRVNSAGDCGVAALCMYLPDIPE